MPGAARVGDMTAHGGFITTAAASVLIEGKPAARVGDMHACPQINPGPSPHVGGGISSGVNSVLIEGQVAATIGSLCQCCGPPDNIAQGAISVMIGGQVRVSPGTQHCINSLRDFRQKHRAPPPAARPRHFLDLRFVDDLGNPIAALPYSLSGQQLPAQPGELDQFGRLQRYDLAHPGRYCVRLQALTKLQWDRVEAAFDDDVSLIVQFSDEHLCQPQPIAVYALYCNGQSGLLKQWQGHCQRGRINQTWRVTPAHEARFSIKAYYFTVRNGQQVYRSPLLRLQHTLEVQVHRRRPASARMLHFSLPDGARQQALLDANGHCYCATVAAGVYTFDLAVGGDYFAE